MSTRSIRPSHEVTARAVQDTSTYNIAISIFGGYTDFGPSVSFAKTRSDTTLLVIGFVEGYADAGAAASNWYFAARVNGTDYQFGIFRPPVLNAATSCGGVVNIGGVPAGTYTVQMRASTDGAPPNMPLKTNSAYQQSMVVMEVAAGVVDGVVPTLAGWVGNELGPSSRNTTSTTYVNWGPSVSFTKRSSGTRLVVIGTGSMYRTVAALTATLGVNINSTDYDVVKRPIDVSTSHTQLAGATEITGLAAGTYTAQLRAKTSAGQINVDSGDCSSITILEVP